MTDLVYSASALYDGGWRSEDKEELMMIYDLTEEEVALICDALSSMEEIQGDKNNQ